MVDKDKFKAARKSNWISKIVTGGEAMWLTLLYNDIPNLQLWYFMLWTPLASQSDANPCLSP